MSETFKEITKFMKYACLKTFLLSHVFFLKKY